MISFEAEKFSPSKDKTLFIIAYIKIIFFQGRGQTWVRVPFAPPNIALHLAPPNIALHLIFIALHLEKMLLLHSTKSPLSLDSYKVLLILLVYDHL